VIVCWVTGKRKTLARAIAVDVAHAKGTPWDTLTLAQREKMVSHFEKRIDVWTKNEVLVAYEHEWLDPEDPRI
jgi:hypothetical protein